LVARFVRDEEAVGSNPATPTKMVLLETSAGKSRPDRAGVIHSDQKGLPRSRGSFYLWLHQLITTEPSKDCVRCSSGSPPPRRPATRRMVDVEGQGHLPGLCPGNCANAARDGSTMLRYEGQRIPCWTRHLRCTLLVQVLSGDAMGSFRAWRWSSAIELGVVVFCLSGCLATISGSSDGSETNGGTPSDTASGSRIPRPAAAVSNPVETVTQVIKATDAARRQR